MASRKGSGRQGSLPTGAPGEGRPRPPAPSILRLPSAPCPSAAGLALPPLQGHPPGQGFTRQVAVRPPPVRVLRFHFPAQKPSQNSETISLSGSKRCGSKYRDLGHDLGLVLGPLPCCPLRPSIVSSKHPS